MEAQKQVWTEEIKSHDGLLSVNLREVWHYRDLLIMLLKRDFITFYKQTILGPLWFFLQPIMTTAMFVIIFNRVARIDVGDAPPVIFYLAGVTIWNYFSDSLTKTSTVFKDNASVFGKVYFPRLIMPLSIVCSALLKFAIQFGLFVLAVLYFTFVTEQIHPNLWALMTPVLILMMAAFALGLGMIFSSMTTKYKDLTFLLTFGIQLFMYATPIIYPSSALPDKYRSILELNPLAGIVECFRYGYLGTGEFNPYALVTSAVVIAVILVTGVIIFNKVEKSFMDTV
jgi:lipopolysaccharide transport system permease protein